MRVPGPVGGVTEDELPLERLYRWEREKANRVFLTQPIGAGVREWTWEQAAREIRLMAGHLAAQNWGAAAKVAILSRNCAWWMMADLAISMAGYVTVPIYPSLRADTVRQILEHSEARACFLGATDEREKESLGIPPEMYTIRFPTAGPGPAPEWDTVIAASQPIAGNPTRAADDIATVFYTSGTTGAPKGVVHRFRAFGFLAQSLNGAIDLAKEHRVLSYLPLAHIVERGGLEMPAVVFGWHVFFTQGLETFLVDLQRARPTIFLSVPRLLQKFQQGVFAKVPRRRLDRLLRVPLLNRLVHRRILRGLGLDTVEYAACGAASLAPELLRWYRDLGLNLVEGYGLTEAMITHLPRVGTVRPGYVGQALDGVEAKRSEDGELLLRSPMNMLGYYKDPQATRAAFTEDGFFRTGDLVEIDADGQLKIIGRLKEQFKTTKGKYVAPAPIESMLIVDPDVDACCVMGDSSQRPFAVAVLSEEARRRCADPAARKALEDSLGERLDRINAKLDPHERVMFIAIIDEPWTVSNGLMTPTLKLRRSPIEKLYAARAEAWREQGKRVVWESGRIMRAA
jgi:long-chain acyl-CoA synthetase